MVLTGIDLIVFCLVVYSFILLVGTFTGFALLSKVDDYNMFGYILVGIYSVLMFIIYIPVLIIIIPFMLAKMLFKKLFIKKDL